MNKKFSKWLHRLFDLRQDADYGNMFEPSQEQRKESVENAREVVQRIRYYFENERT